MPFPGCSKSLCVLRGIAKLIKLEGYCVSAVFLRQDIFESLSLYYSSVA